jgi:signal transduction histidine kinase
VLNLGSDIPQTRVDPGAMRQVFMNIIMNAFYFMDKEGKIVVQTAYDKKDEMVIITISDNGRGIKRELLKRIFDPFFTTKPAGKGTGLGLSISHRIVSEHDGMLDVDSTEGKGSIFSIKLPVRR